MLKTTFQHFLTFYEIFGNLRVSSEKFGRCRKLLKTIFRHFLKIFENFRKSSEIFENLRKSSENVGNPRKIFECNRRFMKIFYTISISDTFELKIRFKNFDLQFALVLHFLHWCYSLTTLLSANQNRVIFSCMLLSKKNFQLHLHLKPSLNSF